MGIRDSFRGYHSDHEACLCPGLAPHPCLCLLSSSFRFFRQMCLQMILPPPRFTFTAIGASNPPASSPLSPKPSRFPACTTPNGTLPSSPAPSSVLSSPTKLSPIPTSAKTSIPSTALLPTTKFKPPISTCPPTAPSAAPTGFAPNSSPPRHTTTV